MSLYRLSLEYVSGHWQVYRCWKVDPRWADRVVDVDRRHSPKLRLRLLGTYPHPKGRRVNPSAMLRYYWKAMRESARPPKLKEQFDWRHYA